MLVTKSKFVVLADVPVDAGKDIERVTLHIAAAKRLLDACEGLVLVDDFLCCGSAQVSVGHASVVARGIALVVVLEVDEEEELVFHNRAADVTAHSVVVLLGERTFHVVVRGIILSIEALVVVVTEESGMEVVGTLLGDGVDATAGETALTNVEWSDNDLDFLDCVH